MINIKLVLTSNYARLKLSTKIIIIAYFIISARYYNTILVSIPVYSLFISFIIIGMPS